MSGEGSNDPVPNPRSDDLGAAEQTRQSARSNVASNTQSPEALEQARKESEAQARLLKQADLKIKKQELYEKALKRTEKAVQEARKGNERDLRVLAKEAGAWDPDKGFLIIGEDGRPQPMTPEQFKDALKRGDDEAKKFEKQLAVRVAAKQGAYSGPSGMIGSPTNRPGFHVGDLISAISTGNFGGIARELMQPLGGDKWQAMIKERGAMMAERGAVSSGLGGLARGLGGRLMAVAPMLATPAALLGAQQLISRTTAQMQGTVREGQVTGGGFGEGLAARRETLQLAANPFDMLDRRTAQQIVSGIRGRGFTGELGRALQDTVGDVFQDLGTDIEETMQMATTVVRENIMTIDEFRDSMRDLDDQAKATGLSVKTIQANLKSVMDLAAAAGGAPAAGQAMLNQATFNKQFADLAGVLGEGNLPGVLQPVLQRGAQMFGGVPAMFAGSQAVQQDAGRYFDQIADFLYRQMQGLPAPFNNINGLAMWLAGPGQALGLTGGMTDVAQIELFLKALFKGRENGGFQAKVASDRAAAAKSAADARLKAEKSMQVGFSQVTGPAAGASMLFNAVKNRLGMGGTEQDSMKSALQKLRTDMETAGVDPAKISDILSGARKAAFAKGLDTPERTAIWKPAWLETTREAEREIKITLDMRPEASRYFQGINATNTAYIAGGKNSQYRMRPPAIGR